MSTIANPMPGIGDNRPPSDADPLRERLSEDYADLVTRRDDLLEAAERIPEIDSDSIAGKVADFIKQLAATVKAAESHRVAEKEPYLASGRTVDGWFKGISDPLSAKKKAVEQRLTVYQRKKAEEERRRREEAERIARAEAERQRKEAEAAAAALAEETDLDAAIEADERAKQAQADAVAAERAADAKQAELSRTRGEYGSVASLRTFWVGEVEDRDRLDLEALRPHFSLEDMNRAVRSFVKAGGRQLSGAKIFEDTQTVVR